MNLAVNYSRSAAGLVREGLIAIDRFKCHYWPDHIASARELAPVYVHFPLKVSPDARGILDSDTGRPPDWRLIETLLAGTDTPYLNLHLTPADHELPGAPTGQPDGELIDTQAAHVVAQLQPLIDRYGAGHLSIENSTALWPQVVALVVRRGGCGFLFDVAHASLAARELGLPLAGYCRHLPLKHTREIHIAGVQPFQGHWLDRAADLGLLQGSLGRYAGRLLDHLPMTEADWQAAARAMQQVRDGFCGSPWIVTIEYGGVGGFFDISSERSILEAHVPRLRALLRPGPPRPSEASPA